MMSIHRKYYHYYYRVGTYIIRTKWYNRIKRKYICISKRNSEIVSGSVNIQNDLIYFSLPSNDTFLFLAHLSRTLTGELIVYPCSGVRPSSTISKIFSSETAWPIKANLHVEHPWIGGKKVYINGPGHMTKMAAMAINSKNL